MNLVETIKNQLSHEVLSELSNVIGIDQQSLEKLLSAIIPGFLGGVSALVSTDAGSKTVTKSLGSPEIGDWGDLAKILRGGGAAKAEEKGGDLVGSLFGGGTVVAMVTALVKFANADGKLVKRLLGIVGPWILSMIAAQFKNQALTPASLSKLMTEQKSNITNSLPPGFEVPDLSKLAPAGGGGLPGWLIPLAAAIAIAIGFYMMSKPQNPAEAPAVTPEIVKPPVPKVAEVIDPATMSKDLADVFKTVTESLGTVKDVPTAQAIVPRVETANSTLDKLKGIYDKIPGGARKAVIAVVTEGLPKIRELVTKVLAIPGVSEKVKPILDALLEKLMHFSQ
jgi:hypothetical protein